MDLNRLNARLAPRSSWQAVDLGTRFYRRWWRQASLVWLVFTAVPFALLAGYAAATRSVWPLLLFWWLKPLWERPLLAFYSRALFDDYPGPLALLRAFPQYGLNGLAAQLTWRRFSPSRGFLTGVWQLEGTRGAQVSGRIAVMLRPPGQRAGTLTFTVLGLEHAMTVALVVLAMTLVPWQFNLEWSVWFQEQSHLQWGFVNLAWYLVLMVTEPLYVATSFALYLNQRTWLEGWDLQLGLTRIGERRRRAGGAALLVLLALCGAAPHPVEAQAPPPGQAESRLKSLLHQPCRSDFSRDNGTAHQADPKQQAIDLLASDTFMPFEERQDRRLRESLRDDDGDSWWQDLLRRLLDQEPDGGGRDPLHVPDGLITGLGYLLLALLLVVILMMVRRYLPGVGGRGPDGKPVMPVRVAGLDTRAESLPADLEQALDQELARGDVRAALALLLRDGLVTLFHYRPLPLTAGATEQDCLRAYQRELDGAPVIAWLSALINAWTRTAWAHRPSDEQAVRELMARWRALRPPLAGGPR
ncbi:MAG: DUF4129 domain-containing protein [Alcanivorax sp.]|uniref:DUF4129 domain-containing protein n=1 Tax=Alloalcanivorax marinus TaxID=1177169 RepID=UPI001959BFFF|nr:DUF4129 domain-containing protein [Alloalcanivorax marinus]MBM7334701.1 DUF4129 domain-containing protein [Alloalcanivorax marinus]